MSKPFLLVVQVEQANPGRVARKLRERGYELEIRCPVECGHALPEALDDYAGAVVFGGPMSANDDSTLPGIRAELEWIPKVVESGKPFLGICLGAQLLARALGARVAPHPAGMAEIGYFPVCPTVDGGELFDGPLCVYHWHQEGFEIPSDAVLLAQGERFPNQAFRYGDKAFGIQFHPEVTADIMETWLERAAHKLGLPGAQSPDQQRAGNLRHDAAFERWLDRFLDRWLPCEGGPE
ncbi:MAG: gamma-glutamyl-gamma-aminobutyrate hydrolase family protein [Gammaproteobacteria bacterium]|nr:gamma-glutamyl-gamma-aminobutyrate hydrolase family protein [Gammaproteobacteria bacterium]MCP5423861.1 gamma-glutamyl-gamma-aminobutyrate hydrolase family protein [Gammaproteobacteria bacterium]